MATSVISKLKVLVVHKREIFRTGLSLVLAEQGIKVVGRCGSAAEAAKLARETEPDVVLVDSELRERGCLATTELVCQNLPRARVLILTHSDLLDYDLLSAFKAGARGLISKDAPISDLVQAIMLIADGGVVICPHLAERMLAEFTTLKVTAEEISKAEAWLTARENEVLTLLAKGASNKEIADKLCITQNTVKVHLRNIMEKLHVHSRLQAAVLAQKLDLASAEGESREHTA